MFRGRIVDYETSTSLFVFDMDSKIKTTWQQTDCEHYVLTVHKTAR